MLNKNGSKVLRIFPGLDRLLYGGESRIVKIAVMDALAPQTGINKNYSFAAGCNIDSILEKVVKAASSVVGSALIMAPEEQDWKTYQSESTVISRYSTLIQRQHSKFQKINIHSIDRREWYKVAGVADYAIGTEDPTPYGNIHISISTAGTESPVYELPSELVERMLYSGHGNRVIVCGGNSELARKISSDSIGFKSKEKILYTTTSAKKTAEIISSLWDPDSAYEHVSVNAPKPLSFANKLPNSLVLDPAWRSINAGVVTPSVLEAEANQWWTVAVVVSNDEDDLQVMFTNGVTKP